MNDWKQWDGFEGRLWKEEVNTRDFIQKNYQPYDGDASFLEETIIRVSNFWKVPRKRPTGCGVFYRNYRRRSVPKAECWIWIRMWFPR